MTFIALAMATVLLVLAALHAYWGLGGFWPGTDALSLSRTVAGFDAVAKPLSAATKPPSSAMCFMVALALALAALFALILGGVTANPFPLFILAPATLILTLVFLGRGVAGFTAAWRRHTPMQPFARLDRLYYSPLCLLIGAGFLTLAIRGLTT